ncbi:MAG: ATP-binding cassette domain-containing protein, partial [Dokdonella sp.]
MAAVRLDNLRKVYDNGYVGVAGASFEVAHAELLVLVGPSGCGKSTLLRMIAGLETITSGTLTIGERVVNDVSPRDRDIAMVFQNYALYPHMSVAENLAFGLTLR